MLNVPSMPIGIRTCPELVEGPGLERSKGMAMIRIGVWLRIVTLSEAKSLLNPRRWCLGTRFFTPGGTNSLSHEAAFYHIVNTWVPVHVFFLLTGAL